MEGDGFSFMLFYIAEFIQKFLFVRSIISLLGTASKVSAALLPQIWVSMISILHINVGSVWVLVSSACEKFIAAIVLMLDHITSSTTRYAVCTCYFVTIPRCRSISRNTIPRLPWFNTNFRIFLFENGGVIYNYLEEWIG